MGTMASEDLFQEDFSEETIAELDQDLVEEIIEPEEEENLISEQLEETAENGHADAIDELESSNAGDETQNRVPQNNGTALREKTSCEPKLFQLPMTRIRNLMKLDPDLHIASNEAVFSITRATELFIESLARESYSFTAQSKKKTIQKRDVDLAIASVDSLMFLEGAMNF